MTTVAERLKTISGLTGVTVASMLLAIGTSGDTMAERLVSRSGQTGITVTQHLLHDQATPEQPSQYQPPQFSSGGGGWTDAGTGYVKTKDGWVNVDKIAISGTRVYKTPAHTASTAFVGQIRTQSKSYIVAPIAISEIYGRMSTTSSGAYSHDYDVSSNAEVGLITTSVIAEVPRDVEWLSIDELLVALEELR